MQFQQAQQEEPLGGTFSEAVRIGDSVRRQTGPWTPTVHRLLAHLRASGIAVPEVLGIEGEHERLRWVEGSAVWEEHFRLWASEERLAAAGRLLRRVHAAFDTFEPRPEDVWRLGWGRGHVGIDPICHNDFAPWNVVVTPDGDLVIIDWDSAAPAKRMHEVAYAASTFVPLRGDAECESIGWPVPPDRVRRLEVFWRAYGLPDSQREEFADALVHSAEDILSFVTYMHRAGRDPWATQWRRNDGETFRENVRVAREVAGEWLNTGRTKVPALTLPTFSLPGLRFPALRRRRQGTRTRHRTRQPRR